MSIETDATRLAMIKAVGGEPFDTGLPGHIWLVFDYEYQESVVADRVVANRVPVGEARDSDIEAHELIRDSVITRVSDGSKFRIKHFEPDGLGMTRIFFFG